MKCRLLLSDGSGGITSTIIGGNGDDGADLLLHSSLQDDSSHPTDNPTDNTLRNIGNTKVTGINGGQGTDTLHFQNNNTIQSFDTKTKLATTLATGVQSVSSIAASDGKVCWHDDTKSEISCASNNSDSGDNVRKNVFNTTKLHFQQDGSSNESNPCEVENGGCDHFCIRTDDGHRCDCGDGHIVNGSLCIPQGAGIVSKHCLSTKCIL